MQKQHRSAVFLQENVFNLHTSEFLDVGPPENSVKEAPLLGRGEVYLFTSYAL